MPAAEDTTAPLEPDHYYHIFNRGNNRENIFYSQENYQYFLRKYDQYLSNYLDTYCFCLLPNHFHLLVRIKSPECILQQATSDFKASKYADLPIDQMVSERFRRFFLSYSKSINKQRGRVGSLFQKPFRRKKVTDDAYFTSLVRYIHNNPVHHGIYSCYRTYLWSSYRRILADRPSKLMKEEVIEWFGGRKNYLDFHQSNIDADRIEQLIF